MRRAGRLHAPELDALIEREPSPSAASDAIELRAPRPGVFVPWVEQGDLVTAGTALGALVVLGRAIAVIAPRSAGSRVTGMVRRLATTASRAVGYGDVLVALDPSLQLATADPEATAAAQPAVGRLVFRAPTSGRFYGRSSPDKPAFVAEGTQLAHGATICLLEVMKTFHRVTYGGPGLPDTARVVRVLVTDGDDVNLGDPLLALE
jgi:acetyl-CoA carboxylase biotin carboxyl carrier protein